MSISTSLINSNVALSMTRQADSTATLSKDWSERKPNPQATQGLKIKVGEYNPDIVRKVFEIQSSVDRSNVDYIIRPAAIAKSERVEQLKEIEAEVKLTKEGKASATQKVKDEISSIDILLSTPAYRSAYNLYLLENKDAVS